MAFDTDKLPPIGFASRGFILKDGSVIGWSLLDGMHSEYHMIHGTSDCDFQTRWRQWSEGSHIDFEERPVKPEWDEAVQEWISQNADEIIPLPRGSRD